MFQDVTLQKVAFCFSILNIRIFRLHTHAAARLYIAITAPEFAHFSSVGATHGCFVPIPQLETGYFQAWTEIKGQIIAGARDLRAGLSIPAPTVRLSKPLQTSNFPSAAVSDQHMGDVYRSRSWKPAISKSEPIFQVDTLFFFCCECADLSDIL